jgi:hypothetical protein
MVSISKISSFYSSSASLGTGLDFSFLGATETVERLKKKIDALDFYF